MKYRQRKSRLMRDSKYQARTTKFNTLRDNCLIFDALAKGLAAGLTPAASIGTIAKDDSGLGLKPLVSSLESGKSVMEALRKHQLGSDFDHALIKIGETSGHLAIAAQFIAKRYEQIIDRKRRIKSKLRMPVLVGLLAVVLIPLPDFVAGTIAPVRYFIGVLASAIILFSLWVLAKHFLSKNIHATTGYPSHRFMGVPIIDALICDYSRADFLERLHLLYASGYPLIEAVELSHESLVGFARRLRYRELTQDLHQGYSLADTFEHHEVLSAAQLPLLSTGEAAGKLEETLAQIAGESRVTYDRKVDTFVTWFPRLSYTLLTLTIASKIL